MPKVSFNEDMQTVTIEYPDQKDIIYFSVDDDNRTNMIVERNGKIIN